MFTWSFGCTGSFEPMVPPRISIARLAMTSLAFMFDWVPEPVCHTTSGKWPSSAPEATSDAASTIASASLGSSFPRSRLCLGAGALDDAQRVDDRRRAGAPNRWGSSSGCAGSGAPVAVGGNLQRPEARLGAGVHEALLTCAREAYAAARAGAIAARTA